MCVIILIPVVVFFVWFISKNILTTEEVIEKMRQYFWIILLEKIIFHLINRQGELYEI